MIVTAGPAQAAAFEAIHAACFTGAAAWDARAFAELLATPSIHGLVDARGGAILLRAAADEAEIVTLAVSPPARRQGVGCGLLTAAMDLLAACGVRRVFLEVADTNAAARSLYEAAGFGAAGRRLGYYADGSDALLLRRDLP